MFGFTTGECMWKVNKAGFFYSSQLACAIISVKSLCFSPIVISTDALAYIILEHEGENTMAFSIRLKMVNSKRL